MSSSSDSSDSHEDGNSAAGTRTVTPRRFCVRKMSESRARAIGIGKSTTAGNAGNTKGGDKVKGKSVAVESGGKAPDKGKSTVQSSSSLSEDDDDDFTTPLKNRKKRMTAQVSEQTEHGYFPVMRCSPAVLYKLIKSMSRSYKERLSRLGFGDLLKFRIETLEHRCLGMFLMRNVKEDPLRIEFQGKVLPITADVVHKIFGLPMGPKPFPKFKDREKKEAKKELRAICEEKGMKDKYQATDELKAKYKNLMKYAVPRWILEQFACTNAEVFDDWAVRFFFMIVCNAFLFPTSDYHITGPDILMCKDLGALAEYNWCEAVVNDIRLKAAKWQQKYGLKKTPIIQGCTALLMVYYLDNLDCPDVERNMDCPRSSLYSKELVEKIMTADRTTLRDGSVLYGKLPLLSRERTVYADIRGDNGEQPREQNVEHDDLAVRYRIVLPVGKSLESRPAAAEKPKAPKAHVPKSNKGDCSGTASLGLIQLEPLLAQSLASFCDSSKKDAVKDALRNYDSSVASASREICEGQRKIAKAERAMEAAKRQIQKGQLDLHNAQKKMLADVNAILHIHEMQPVSPSEREQRAKRRSSGTVSTPRRDTRKRQKTNAAEAEDNTEDSSGHAPSLSPVREQTVQDPTPPGQTIEGDRNVQTDEQTTLCDPVSTSEIILDPTQSLTAGLSEGGFDREGWNDTTNILRSLDEDLTQREACIGKDFGNVSSQSQASGIPVSRFDQDTWSDLADILRDIENDASQKDLHVDVGKPDSGSQIQVEVPDPKSFRNVYMRKRSSSRLQSKLNPEKKKLNADDIPAADDNPAVADTPIYSPPGRPTTRSIVGSNDKLFSGLHDDGSRGLRKRLMAKKGKKQSKQAQEGMLQVDEHGFPIVDIPPDPVPPGLASELKWYDGIAATENFGNKVEPFKDEWRRRLPDVDKSLQMRSFILGILTAENVTPEQDLFKRTTFIQYTEKMRKDDFDGPLDFSEFTYSIQGFQVYEGFADDEMGSSDNIDLSSIFMMIDDKNSRCPAHGYRIVLPTLLSNNIVWDVNDKTEKYQIDMALKLIRMRFTPDDLVAASLVFFPVCFNKHWTVYCINKVHNQIDILDPLNCGRDEGKDNYHAKICEVIRGRLHELLRVFTDGIFPDISKWDMPYVSVPCQKVHSKDCVFYCMLFIENYIGTTRKMDISLDSTKAHEYRAQYLYYLMFHPSNQAMRPFPASIEGFGPE